MLLVSQSPLQFAFYFLNPDGQNATAFTRKGAFDGETLTLDKRRILADKVLSVTRRQNRLALLAINDASQVESIWMRCESKIVAVDLKEAIDVVNSRRRADLHRLDLERQGRGGYRDADCTHCEAKIVLSDLPETSQVYCPYCETLFAVNPAESVPYNESRYRICDSCHMFSAPEAFLELYIWFVIVAHGHWSQEHWICRACMRAKAWKMLWGNLIFVLGVPFSLYQLSRSYRDSGKRTAYRGLDDGNLKAVKGDITGAIEHYRAILEQTPHSAGVKFNLGQALLRQDNYDQAARSFETALADCANYVPAYQQLRQLYAHLGETDKLNALETAWGATGTPAMAQTD